MTSELDFDAAARLTLKLRKHQRRMEWMSLLFGQMLEQAKSKGCGWRWIIQTIIRGGINIVLRNLVSVGIAKPTTLSALPSLSIVPSVSQDDTNRWEIQDAPAITPRRAEL